MNSHAWHNELALAIQKDLGLTAPAAGRISALVLHILERVLERDGCDPAPELDAANARDAADRFLSRCEPYPSARFQGRGIVVCAGGQRYFRCAWVCLNLLRKFGCRLPVELWYLDDSEFDENMRALLDPLEVRCVNAGEIRKSYPVRILRGWELKPFAILHSGFAEVLLLDADNVPIVDPEFLFEAAAYAATGAIFWPDAGRLPPTSKVWEVCRIPYRDEPEFESGQIVVDKGRCWTALRLTMHMNEHSDFYYRLVHGDKETFHLAWRILDQDYSMIPVPMLLLRGTMCQHDFDGRRIFQHRHVFKWDSYASTSVPGFKFEREAVELCLAFDKLWEGIVNGRAKMGGSD